MDNTSEIAHLKSRIEALEGANKVLTDMLIHTDAMRLMDSNPNLNISDVKASSKRWVEALLKQQGYNPSASEKEGA